MAVSTPNDPPIAWYNEHDEFAAAWLRNLIEAGVIANGIVDERDIQDVKASDLEGFTQCHFFAGIGVWSYTLRQAGWPDDRPVWTGSCPCQPFSTAGKRAGVDDERHLWPAWFYLIKQRRPDRIFGEQVASKDGLAWFDLVSDDLEGTGYTIGAADTCAAGFGAPHIRQRLYFVADPNPQPEHAGQLSGRPEGLCGTGELGHADHKGLQGRSIGGHSSHQRIAGTAGLAGGLDNSTSQGLAQRSSGKVLGGEALSKPERSSNLGFWAAHDEIWCIDGRTRSVEPGSFPLVDGTPSRVGRLRGYGNSLVAPVAQGFIEAYLETERELAGGQ